MISLTEKKIMTSIPNFPGYFVTGSGCVWSAPKKPNGNRWVMLKPSRSPAGYSQVILYKDRIKHQKFIHRIMLETFVGPCPEGMECCHNDGDRSNDKLENLRWDTRRNNTLDSVRHGTFIGNSKLNKSQVREIRQLLETRTLSQRKIAKIFGVTQPTIGYINQRKIWRYLT